MPLISNTQTLIFYSNPRSFYRHVSTTRAIQPHRDIHKQNGAPRSNKKKEKWSYCENASRVPQYHLVPVLNLWLKPSTQVDYHGVNIGSCSVIILIFLKIALLVRTQRKAVSIWTATLNTHAISLHRHQRPGRFVNVPYQWEIKQAIEGKVNRQHGRMEPRNHYFIKSVHNYVSPIPIKRWKLCSRTASITDETRTLHNDVNTFLWCHLLETTACFKVCAI